MGGNANRDHVKMKIDYTTYLSHRKNSRQRFLILHYTVDNFKVSVDKLTTGDVSVHYVIPTLKRIDPSYCNNELIVYALVPEAELAWHAGVSAWGNRANLNDSSIGIEIVNSSNGREFCPYPEQQIDLVVKLCKNILSRYPDISEANVLGHSDIAVGRKEDPGPLFPWEKLHDAGIGAWYDKKTVNQYIHRFKKEMPQEQEVRHKLYQYGYRYRGEFSTLLKTFQMHFRPDDYSGVLDPETAGIAYALVDKYIGSD